MTRSDNKLEPIKSRRMRGVQPVIAARIDASSNPRGSRPALGRARRALAPRPALRATVARRPEAAEHDRPYRASHRGSSPGNNHYHYDLSGNVDSRAGPDIPGGEQSLTYTPFNLPLTISTGEQPTSFEYSADEERLIRRDPGKGTTLYSVSDLYQRKLDISAGTTLEERFRLYAGDRQIGEIVRNGGTDQTLFFHPDDLGSVDTISDSAGNFHQQQFDPFGASINPSTPPLTRAGFTGQDHDDDLGLIDMKGRLYDPLTARFMSQDPVMQAPFWTQGLNRYSYAFNDPVNNTDPSGFDVADTLGWRTGSVGFDIANGAIEGGFVGGGGLLAAYGLGAFSGGSSAAASAGGTTAASAGLSATGVGAGLGALGNVLDTVLTGGPLDGSRQGGMALSVSTPSAHPRRTGAGRASAQAVDQNKGRPGPPLGRLAQEEDPEGEGLEPIEDTILKNLDREISDAERTGEIWQWGHLEGDAPDRLEQGPSSPENAEPEINEQKQAGHIPETPQYLNRVRQNKMTSSFWRPSEANSLTRDAWRTGTQPGGDPRLRIKEYGRPVGVGPNGGGYQTQIRVSIDGRGTIHGTPWGPVYFGPLPP